MGGGSVSVTDYMYLLPISLIISIQGFYMRHVLSSNHKKYARRNCKGDTDHLVHHVGIP